MIKESVVDEFARLRGKMNDFREILLDISGHLTTGDVQELKFLCRDHIPPGKAQKITNAIELFSELENLGLLTDKKREFLASKLITIGKEPLRDKLLGIQDNALNNQQGGIAVAEGHEPQNEIDNALDNQQEEIDVAEGHEPQNEIDNALNNQQGEIDGAVEHEYQDERAEEGLNLDDMADALPNLHPRDLEEESEDGLR